jgi:3-hydroxyacyl-CoA dehydrogenase
MVAMSSAVDLKVKSGVAVLTVNHPPVNALTPEVRIGLHAGFLQVREDSNVQAIVLICAGRTFIVGADISEFGAPVDCPSHHEILDVMDKCAKPIVAAIHGTALGGGLETALLAHYRVSVKDAYFGLPEVKLGLTPGSGGTQRLPRLVGVAKALEMVTSGEKIDAAEALSIGLIDEIVNNLEVDAIAFARSIIGKPLLRVSERKEKLEEAKNKPEIFESRRKAIAHKSRGFEAPEANVRCVEAAVNSASFEEGMKTELEIFVKLVEGQQCAAQRYFFFAERQAQKIPDVPKDALEIPIRKVGVIGAGTMGGGIAMNILNIGLPVTIIETKQEALDRGMGLVRRNYENTAKKGRITKTEVENRMALLTGSLALADLADCDLVIEAVYENMDIKKEIFRKLDAIVKDGAILASNTSGLDVNEIASVTNRPENVIGWHFFSPANVMKLLEIVRGAASSKEVIRTSMSFAKKMGKVPVLVGVCPWFVGNRMLGPRQIQAMYLMQEGASPQQIDKVLFEFGMPMGPYQMSDLAGLDIGWDPKKSKGETIYERMCEAGRFGQKNGKGFYNYDENRMPSPSPEALEIIGEMSENMGITRRDISDEEILDRCLLPTINEAAKILEEGIAMRASDIDVIMVYGFGWPVYRGGPMFHGDQIGLKTVIERMKKYKDLTGDSMWDPAPFLLKLADEGRGLLDQT